MTALAYLRRLAASLKAETVALYLAAQDRRTPWYAKWLVIAIVAYALSPIDLIPDFIPIIGLLDDLILLPMAISIAMRLIPEDVLREARVRASTFQLSDTRAGRVAAVVIVAVWVVAFATALTWAVRRFFD